MSDFLSLSLRDLQARKQHGCIWCPEPIAVGERYKRQASVYCGDFQSNKYHPECWDAMVQEQTEWPDEPEFEAHSHERGKAMHLLQA